MLGPLKHVYLSDRILLDADKFKTLEEWEEFQSTLVKNRKVRVCRIVSDEGGDRMLS